MRLTRRIALSAFIVTFVLQASLFSQIKIVLKNSFIEKYKDRTSIDASYTVAFAHAKPNTPSKDGDLHIAGTSTDIKLNTVSEIMNAASRRDAVDFIHSVEGTGHKIDVSGAWRIWCEHGGQGTQTQGGELEEITNTNPDHVFEIHPLTKVDTMSLLDTFTPISGFTPKKAEDAFDRYEGRTSKITAGRSTTTIITNGLGYNYVEFLMQINSDQQTVVEDGRFVYAKVYDLDTTLLLNNRRMVFLKDTPPEVKVRTGKKGEYLHVLGIPRISLKLLSWRTHHYTENKYKDALTWNLPYEIIVVGLYNE